MDRRITSESIERLYQLAQTIATDSDQAAEWVELVYSRIHATDASSEPIFRDLVDTLDKVVFHRRDDFSPEESGSSLEESHSLMPAKSSSEQRSRHNAFRREEGLRYLTARIGYHFFALDLKNRFDLWVSVQSDLEDRSAGGRQVLDDIRQAVLADMSSVERRALESEIDVSLIREALEYYWNSTLKPLPATLRSLIDSHTGSSPFALTSRSAAGNDRESKKPRRERFSLVRSVSLGLLIIISATGANWLYTIGQPVPLSRDIVLLSVSLGGDYEADFHTPVPEQAERYILDRFGTRLRVPVIRDASLIGIRTQRVRDKIDVPVLIFQDAIANAKFLVFAYSYAFLEDNRRTIELSRNLLSRIEDPSQFGAYFSEMGSALVWRDGDDIFTAVLESDPSQMQTRVELF